MKHGSNYCQTLIQVRDEIQKINTEAGKTLINSSVAYRKHYIKGSGLPSDIARSFSKETRARFIAEYANELGFDKAFVGLWDALLIRPIIDSLKAVSDEIQRINMVAGKKLIGNGTTYTKNYAKGQGQPCSITRFFSKEAQTHFIAEYANEIGVDKTYVKLWDALLMRPVVVAETLDTIRYEIQKINRESGQKLIDSEGEYSKHHKKGEGLPSSVTKFFSKEAQADFIAEYAIGQCVDKAFVGLWDTLLMRRVVVAETLVTVRDEIQRINREAGKKLIKNLRTYRQHYAEGKGLPYYITQFFSEEAQAHFIAEYASEQGVDKAFVDLWDALLMRPVIDTLELIRNEIKKINTEAGKTLIDRVGAYCKYYKKGEGLPCTIHRLFSKEVQARFIAEYANELGVDKAFVGLWDALLMRPVIDTLKAARDEIQRINTEAGKTLIDSAKTYNLHYTKGRGLPCQVGQYFSKEAQAHFIAEYANELGVNKELVGLWGALLKKNIVPFTLDEIKKHYPKWYGYFLFFMESQNNIAQKERAFKNFIQYFIYEFDYSSNPLICLVQKKKKINLNEYENFFSCFGDASKKQFHTVIVEFIDFIIADLSGFDNDTEENESPLISNVFNYFESDILQIKAPKFSESNKPRLAFSYIVKAREWIFPEGCNNFSDLNHLHNLVDQDWIEVDKSQVNAADLNCVWRYRKKDNKSSKRQNTESGRTVEYAYEIWMPTRWLMLYTMLQVPLRGIQVTKLDSGEADSYLPVINNGKIEWIDNPSKLNLGAKQSFIKRYLGDHAGMYVTTNKTSSSQGGYAVPYIPFDLCKWIIQFREFQSTYNPLDKLTPWTEIKLRRKTNAKKLKNMGSQCFLFREMGEVTPMNEAVFRNSFAFVLAQIETKDLKLTKKLNDKNTLNSYETVYTPHTLRVSLISAYITDGKIPIEVVSKIVGHHSLMMTIYYTKIGGGEFRHYLEQAEKNMLKASGDNLALELLEKQLERADENLICNTKGGVEQFTTNWPTSSYFISDIGICPMAGTGCNEGGEIIESTKTRQLYAPVPQGYLGERNCPRCRFFMTGVAFTPGLAAVMHRIQTECGGVNEKYKEHTINVKILEDEAYDCEQDNIPFTKRLELAKSIQNKEAYATRLNAHKVDVVAIARLVEMSLSLVNQSNSKDKLALVTNNEIGDIGIEYNDSSEFQLFDTVCQDSEIYSIVDATNIAPRRTQLIDAMLQANNVNSTLFRMPVQEQLKIGNQVTQLMLKRLGSWDKLNSVAEGRTRLNENSASVVNSSSMKSITKEVQMLIDNAKCSGPQLATCTATNDENVIDVKGIK
ncbi:gamma-mobile-trio integrase GmtZ [Moritella viscosa]|uniref:Integrase family protein n=1 Tax=Moritella viscosa TaxID=80854 RepID=A0A1L0BPS6_9GAMM|nr:VPA1269 family protein [Moritella viscosa]SGZ01017.1 Integrase family protein [Moritella viscosa]